MKLVVDCHSQTFIVGLTCDKLALKAFSKALIRYWIRAFLIPQFQMFSILSPYNKGGHLGGHFRGKTKCAVWKYIFRRGD
jgi:hypothetical protein